MLTTKSADGIVISMESIKQNGNTVDLGVITMEQECGYESGFIWHTYFRCPECGSREYTKEEVYPYAIWKQGSWHSNNNEE